MNQKRPHFAFLSGGAIPAEKFMRMESPAERLARYSWLIVLFWILAVLVLAWSRIPYDDEWFSITLASHTDWSHFWTSLRNDIHLPWFSLLDRVLMLIISWPGVLVIPRALAGGAALMLFLSVLRGRKISPWVAVVAVFHPVVLMYAGSVRWYPYLLLGQALRAWALWGPERGKKSRMAFLAGSFLGPAAQILDLPFVLFDGAVFFFKERKRQLISAATTVILSFIFALIPALAARYFLKMVAGSFGLNLSTAPINLLQWGILGVVGESHPPWPWILFAFFAVPAFLLGPLLALRNPLNRAPVLWACGQAAIWVAGSGFSVWHPRYSLLVWIVFNAFTASLWLSGRFMRGLFLARIGYLACGIAFMAAGTGFLKGDLNGLPKSVCAEIQKSSPDLVVAPYPRTAALVHRLCPGLNLVTVRSIRHYPNIREQLEPLLPEIARSRRIMLLSVPTRGSSLEQTQSRVRDLLASKFHLAEEREIIEDRQAAVKRWFRGGEQPRRLRLELWIIP